MARDKKPKPATLRRSKRQAQVEDQIDQENQQERQEIQSDAPDFFVSIKGNIASSLSNYEERLKGYVCVDKTNIIEAFLKESFPIHLLLRPRRCGKTTLLTMFRSFFELGCPKDVEKRRELFVNMPSLISKSEIFQSNFAQHPVVYIDMSTVKGRSFRDMMCKLERVTALEFLRHQKLGYLENANSYHARTIKRVLDGSEEMPCHAFRTLVETLHEKIGKKVILLIDEYDTPIVDSSEHGYLAEALPYFSEIYGALLKNSSDVVIGTVMAGILRIQQTGFLSGLNNLTPFTLDDGGETSNIARAYAKALLFTSKEVDALYQYYNAKRSYSFDLKDLKQWYGGYIGTGGIELFNPWSVCRALEDGKLKDYWIATGVDNIILRHITKSPTFSAVLQDLLEGKGVESPGESSPSGIDDDLEDDEILDILNEAGYLTKRGSFLYIPNLELQGNFFKWASTTTRKRVKDAIINADSRALFDACISAPPVIFHTLFKSYLEKHGPAKYGHNEDKYHNYILSALQHGSCGRFIVRSESEGGHGRMDILIEEIGGIKAVILELKASRANGTKVRTLQCLPALAEKALKQIDDKKYRARLDDQIVDLREHGIAMYAKSCEISTRIMRREPGGKWVSKYT